MTRYTQGNLLDAPAEVLVNTVNTVGVMGKGIALQFKEAYPENYRQYRAACERGEVEVGRMFTTETGQLTGPRWIINFPTKREWRQPSRMEYIEQGLSALVAELRRLNARSVAMPPLGCGNGGLEWERVRPLVESAFQSLPELDVLLFAPSPKYMNAPKREGVEQLTPARALIAEMVRRYEVLGYECSNLEVQKLAYLLQRVLVKLGLPNPLELAFSANKYGPYSDPLRHLLNQLDGSYLHCDRRLADATPMDVIRFDYERAETLAEYLASPEMKPYAEAIQTTGKLVEGFETPYGMELLATVDWLLQRSSVGDAQTLHSALARWPGGKSAGDRKARIFDGHAVEIARDRLLMVFG